MARICLIAEAGKATNELRPRLADSGFSGSITPYAEAAAVARQSPDIVLIELSGDRPDRTETIIRKLKRAGTPPVMALVPGEMIDHLDPAEEY